jgi:hypothetical protein
MGLSAATGPALGRLSPRLSKAAASILPGAVLVLLPKCPLCLAAWLTFATGVGFSAAGAAWVRAIVLIFWIVAVVLAAASFVRRRYCQREHAGRSYIANAPPM